MSSILRSPLRAGALALGMAFVLAVAIQALHDHHEDHGRGEGSCAVCAATTHGKSAPLVAAPVPEAHAPCGAAPVAPEAPSIRPVFLASHPSRAPPASAARA